MTDKPKTDKDVEKEEKEMAENGEKGEYVVGQEVNEGHSDPSNSKPS